MTNTTKFNQKETEIISSVKTQTISGLRTMYADYLKFDDLFNLKFALGASIRNIVFNQGTIRARIDKYEVTLKVMQAASGTNNITSAVASMNGQESLSQAISYQNWLIDRATYSLELLISKEEAYKDFYSIALGEKYIPYSSNKLKSITKINEANNKASAWNKENADKLDPILEGSEMIPAIIE